MFFRDNQAILVLKSFKVTTCDIFCTKRRMIISEKGLGFQRALAKIWFSCVVDKLDKNTFVLIATFHKKLTFPSVVSHPILLFIAHSTKFNFNRALSLGSHVESQENKKLCFCQQVCTEFTSGRGFPCKNKAFFSSKTQHGCRVTKVYSILIGGEWQS